MMLTSSCGHPVRLSLNASKKHPSKLQLKRGSRVVQYSAATEDNNGPSFLETAVDGYEWLKQQEKEIEATGARDAEEVELVKSVGLERAARGVRQIDETDPVRFPWHRRLKTCAEQGEYTDAESILDDMRKSGITPGPLAFHALVLSYVKANYPQGALTAIRKAYDTGIQPTPSTYAAVVHAFLKIEDINRAEAVYASNRRAGVDGSKSWVVLVDGMLRIREGAYAERAVAVLEQGEAEGLRPNSSVYERLIRYLAKNKELDLALERLVEMQELDIEAHKLHIAPVVTAAALGNRMEVAESLFVKLLKAPGKLEAATVGAVNAVLKGYLEQQLTREELAFKVSNFRQTLARFNIGTDKKGYSLYLEAGLYLDDLQLAMFAFRALKRQGQDCLRHVADDQLAEMLLRLSFASRPADLYEILKTMAIERRPIPALALKPDNGRTFVTHWLPDGGVFNPEETEGDDQDDAGAQFILVDGVTLDSVTLTTVDEDGKALAPSKMGVRELRAELAARRFPVKGSKRDLQKKLVKARALQSMSEEDQEEARKNQSKKVEVAVVEEEWSSGRIRNQAMYNDEVEQEEDDTIDAEEQFDDDFEEGSSRKKAAKDEFEDDDDEEEVDYEEIVATMIKAAGGKSIELEPFTNEDAHGLQAIGILDVAITLGMQPTTEDISLLAATVGRSDNATVELATRSFQRVLGSMQASDQSVVQGIIGAMR